MIRNIVIVFLFLLSVEGSPTFDRILEQLEKKGFSNTFSSEDNFQKTIKCVKCNEVVPVSDNGQAAWLLKQHCEKKSHIVKCAWTINEQYEIVSFVQGMYTNWSIMPGRGKGARTCLPSILKEEAAKSTVFFSGRPSHSMKSLSRPTSCQRSKEMVALFFVGVGSSPFVSCPGPRLDRKCT